MVPRFVSPKFELEAFNCPNCQVYCSQKWFKTYFLASNQIPNLTISLCTACNKFSLWFNSELIFPRVASGPVPARDMPAEVGTDYLAARAIVDDSPQAAVALLRRAYIKLIEILIAKESKEGGTVEENIKVLRQYGLPAQICNGLKLARVIGEDLVPPGYIDDTDDKQMAAILFQLLNITVEIMITQPQEISALCANLPVSR